MDISKIKNVYFLGIGGIGMSAVAKYFLIKGVSVSGYDRTKTPMTDELTGMGISVHYDENINKIPEKIDLVVYTPAIKTTHGEYVYLSGKGIPVLKRSEILGIIASQYKVIAVAGTHGKTTTTSMIAHILSFAGTHLIAFIGGIDRNFNSNFVCQENAEYMVVEADEYDRSFLTLFPDIAVITSMDADHLDIYNKKESLTDSFMKFCEQLKPEGTLVIRKNLPYPVTLFSRVHTYSAHSQAENAAVNMMIDGESTVFDLVCGKKEINHIRLGIPGIHNIENAIAAIVVALKTGIEPDVIKRALASYKGVGRRFDYRINTPGMVYIDDYAHHPKELDAFIEAVKTLYPGRKITGVFQPHLYSRTLDFADDFAISLSRLDELILLDIYPARELPIEGVTSELLLGKVKTIDKKLMSKETLMKYIDNHDFEVLLTIGAGDIDQLVTPVETCLLKKMKL